MITLPGKIPITVHPLFWLLALFIGFMSTSTLSGTLLSVIVILISVLFHEYGHALTGMAFGQKTRIELAAFGGFTYRQGRKLKLWEEFLVVLNGPLAGLVLCGISWWVFRQFPASPSALAFMLRFSILVNFFWTIINLVPVLPLDGGHLMSIILEAIFGFRGVKIAIVASLIIAVAICVFFFAIGQFLVGALFLILTFESFRSLRYYKIMKDKDRDTDLQDLVRSADKDFQSGNYPSALQKLQEVRNKTKEGLLYMLATQEMAEIYKEQGKYEEAYQLLIPIRASLSNENLNLFHLLAYKNSDYKTITEIGNQCYQSFPSYETALINALAYGALGQTEPSIGWLECSIRDGLPNIREAIRKKEFDSIRRDQKFKSLEEILEGRA
jgi:stage IV sporulation protein FB